MWITKIIESYEGINEKIKNLKKQVLIIVQLMDWDQILTSRIIKLTVIVVLSIEWNKHKKTKALEALQANFILSMISLVYMKISKTSK